jgi:hypothetical protein
MTRIRGNINMKKIILHITMRGKRMEVRAVRVMMIVMMLT